MALDVGGERTRVSQDARAPVATTNPARNSVLSQNRAFGSTGMPCRYVAIETIPVAITSAK